VIQQVLPIENQCNYESHTASAGCSAEDNSNVTAQDIVVFDMAVNGAAVVVVACSDDAADPHRSLHLLRMDRRVVRWLVGGPFDALDPVTSRHEIVSGFTRSLLS